VKRVASNRYGRQLANIAKVLTDRLGRFLPAPTLCGTTVVDQLQSIRLPQRLGEDDLILAEVSRFHVASKPAE
jgi:hypothetical protein